MSLHLQKFTVTFSTAFLFILLLGGCAKEDGPNPISSEDETIIPGINRLRAAYINTNTATYHSFQLVSFVGIDDTNTMSHFNTKEKKVYTENEINQDLNLSKDVAISFHALSETGMLFCTSSSMTKAYFESKGWTLSDTKFQETSMTAAQFDALNPNDLSTIEGAFNDIGPSSKQIYIYDNNVPMTNKVISFKTDDGKKGVIKVKSITGDVLNDLSGHLKANLAIWITP